MLLSYHAVCGEAMAGIAPIRVRVELQSSPSVSPP
jgi:hypothetical protein